MTKEEIGLDRILQLYIPDDYYEEIRMKLIPHLIDWKNQKRTRLKKVIPPHTCVYEEEPSGKFRCKVCRETVGQSFFKELQKDKKKK